MMKKISIFILIFLFLGALAGCSTSGNTEYEQRILSKPDCIEITNSGELLSVYDKDSEEYLAVYNALNANWWKNDPEEAESVTDESLTEVENIKTIKTTSDMRYVTGDQIFVNFIYNNGNTMLWSRSTGNNVELVKITFVLPPNAVENKNVKSFFAATNTESNISSEGIYTYYYSDEVFNAISEGRKTITTEYLDEATEVDLSHFSDITIDEMEKILLEVNGWTHLEDHAVYWNSASKQVVLNYTFSEKTSEKELGSARNYWDTINLFRSHQNTNPDVNAIWRMIPKEAEVIIQVYNAGRLLSQDIYSEVENGIIYKEKHYER